MKRTNKHDDDVDAMLGRRVMRWGCSVTTVCRCCKPRTVGSTHTYFHQLQSCILLTMNFMKWKKTFKTKVEKDAELKMIVNLLIKTLQNYAIA